MGYETITDLGLSFGDGGENPSGIAELAYLIPISWFALNGIKAPTASTTAGSLNTISVAHVLAATKAAIRVNPLFSKSGGTWKLTGEELSKMFESSFDLFVPDNSAKSLGTIQAIKNMRFIVLIAKSDGSGHFWQLGTEHMSAKVIAADGGTGVGPGGEVGTKITVQSHSIAPVYTYTAGVPVPAT